MMDVVDICECDIDVVSTLSRIRSPESGGTASFLGSTRDHCGDRRVLHLEYETYRDMALKEMQRLCAAMRTRWPLTGVALVHRVGIVPVAEVSVLVAASAPHRKEAMEAVAFGIDSIKTRVPIWKKEVYDNGSYNWKGEGEQGGVEFGPPLEDEISRLAKEPPMRNLKI